MPFEEHIRAPPEIVPRKISCPASSVSVDMNTSFAFPPASQGRSPSWHCGVPSSQFLPPSGDENRASLTRSMPVSYMRPLASVVRSGSLNPVLIAGEVGQGEFRYLSRCQVTPASLDVQMLTWLQ